MFFKKKARERLLSVQPEVDFSKTHIDELIDEAALVALSEASVSVYTFQRHFGFGHARSYRFLDQLEMFGVIEPYNGSRPRKVLISQAEYEKYIRPKIMLALDQQKEYREKEREKAREEAANGWISAECDWVLSKFGPDTYDYLDEDNRLSLYYADNLDGHAFEEWCAELLLDNGFYDVAVTPGSGDQGVDVLAVKGGVKYAIQCKCYSNDLGNTPIQEVHAGKSLYGCHVGVVMTNRHFTSGAKQLADATGVLLWDREALQEMIEIAQQVIEV